MNFDIKPTDVYDRPADGENSCDFSDETLNEGSKKKDDNSQKKILKLIVPGTLTPI